LASIQDEETEKEFKNFSLGVYRKRSLKENGKFTMVYEVTGSEKKLEEFNLFLKKNEKVASFEY
jgi:hypothetical protein